MTKSDKTFLFDLLETPSPTGWETPGQRKWAAHVETFADRVESDAYGTAWGCIDAAKPATAPTVMIEAHADEIGYIVKYISDEGFVYIDCVGGSDAATARGRMLRFLGEKGEVFGIVGNTAIHIREDRANEKAPKIHELYVDIGAKNKAEVLKMGLRVGIPAVYTTSAHEFGTSRIVGRALDNRIGGYIIAKALEQISKDKKRPAFNVVAVNSVQEEIGGYGAKMATHRLMPDVCLCLDVTHATDTPGIKKEVHGDTVLGGGPTITHGTCNHPKVVEKLMAVAKSKKIALQHESSGRYSGTDTDSIYHVKEGVPSGLISLPLRYMHSVVEMVDIKDLEKTIQLMAEFIRALKPKDDFKIKL